MKNINRLLAAASILLSAAACHTNEIDNPGHTDPVNPDPGTPDESGLTISASIVKTRVTYSDIDADLDQEWDVGDILFGYYGGVVDNKVILTVSGFDEAGNAILIPAEGVGAATLKDLAKLEGTVPVDLVYIGANVSAADYLFDNDGNLTIDMSPKDGVQDGVNIPACMHARAYVQTDKNDPNKKSLFFKFVNDCAIIEIYSLTGVKEKVSDGTKLESISVSNLLLQGTYSWSESDGFTFEQTDNTSEKLFSTGNLSNWFVDSDGSIYYDDKAGNTENRYLIAVVPNNISRYIEVNASIDGINYGYGYGLKEENTGHYFEAGKCYVIHEADVVAKTIDGLYFTTVTGAFEHAAELFDSDNLDAEHNIVTLVRDCGFAGIDDKGAPKAGDEDCIYIDGYDVTLDLNGHTLSLIDGDYDTFYVNGEYNGDAGGDVATDTDPRNTFVIKDSKGNGKLLNNAYYHAVVNFGSFVLTSGIMDNYNERTAVMNSGSFTMYGGKLLKSNTGYNTYALQNINGNANIYGGYIYSNADVAIECDADSKLIIGDDSSKDILISSSGTGAIALNNSEGLIYSGTITCSTNNTIVLYNDSKCTISGGNIICTGEYSAIKCTNNNGQDSCSELYITWPSDTRSIGISRKEPFLYSHSVTQHYAPVFVASGVDGKNNSATIHILGGFIYNEDTTDLSKYLDRGCFSVNRGNGHALNSDNDFYSNVTRFYEINDTPKGDKEKYDESYTTDYYSIPKSRVEDGAEGDLIFTYHIMGAIDPTLSPDTEAGKTQSYQFGGFSW